MKERVSLKPETRWDYYIDEKMKKVWNVQLDLLAKFDEVCKKYNLKYYADGGTLIGIIRHKGYIPWDDDIDITMFRKDYDKLIEVGQKEFTYPYFLQSSYSEKNYYRGHAQLRNSETTAILKGEREEGKIATHNKGIFIDIFILDGISSDKKLLKKQEKKFKLRMNIVNRYRTKKTDKRLIKGRLQYFLLWMFFKIYSPVKFWKKTEDILRKVDVDDCELIGTIEFKFDPEKRKLDKHWYDDSILMDFETMKLPVPIGYDKLLKQFYGDYMKPVKAPSLHGEVFFDPEKSYKEYENT